MNHQSLSSGDDELVDTRNGMRPTTDNTVASRHVTAYPRQQTRISTGNPTVQVKQHCNATAAQRLLKCYTNNPEFSPAPAM